MTWPKPAWRQGHSSAADHVQLRIVARRVRPFHCPALDEARLALVELLGLALAQHDGAIRTKPLNLLLQEGQAAAAQLMCWLPGGGDLRSHRHPRPCAGHQTKRSAADPCSPCGSASTELNASPNQAATELRIKKR